MQALWQAHCVQCQRRPWCSHYPLAGVLPAFTYSRDNHNTPMIQAKCTLCKSVHPWERVSEIQSIKVL